MANYDNALALFGKAEEQNTDEEALVLYSRALTYFESALNDPYSENEIFDIQEFIEKCQMETEAILERMRQAKAPTPISTKRPSSSMINAYSNDESDEAIDNIVKSMILREKCEATIKRINDCSIGTGKTLELDKVIGLEEAKESLWDTVKFLCKKSEDNVVSKPRSTLLFGPPESGKKCFVHALSKDAGVTFISISINDLLSKSLNERGRITERVFEAARQLAPTIICIDQIDLAISEDSNGNGMRHEILSYLKGIMQCKEKIALVGCINYPWLIPRNVLSLFTNQFYVPLPKKDQRFEILKSEISKHDHILLEEHFEELAHNTDGFSENGVIEIVTKSVASLKERIAISKYFLHVTDEYIDYPAKFRNKWVPFDRYLNNVSAKSPENKKKSQKVWRRLKKWMSRKSSRKSSHKEETNPVADIENLINDLKEWKDMTEEERNNVLPHPLTMSDFMENRKDSSMCVTKSDLEQYRDYCRENDLVGFGGKFRTVKKKPSTFLTVKSNRQN